MASTTETPRKDVGLPRIGGCGGCSYIYDPHGGCYNRQGTGTCSGGCRCSPFICGVGSQVIQNLRPESVTSAAAVSMHCLTAANDEEWIAKALVALALEQSSPAFFWRRVSIGLGVFSVLLTIGLGVALVYR